MSITSMLIMAIVTMTMSMSCLAAPSFKPRSDWPLLRDDTEEAPAILTSNCDPVTGRCWEWLPIGDTRLDEYAVDQDTQFNRVQPIRARDVDQVTSDSWRADNSPLYGRLSKKDVFVSRGWNAGGMPFSVLYMSPRPNHPGAAQSKVPKSSGDPKKKNDDISSPIPLASQQLLPLAQPQQQQQQQQQQQPNNRVAPRNNVHGSTQPRRHYSIIPQLFISYGWGPSGK